MITGGEPTLQKDLITFCNKIKDIGYKIKLDSNGTRPNILETLFNNKLVDFISMDIKTSLANYNLVLPPGQFDTRIITNSIQIVMEKAPLYEFRTTCSRPFVNEEIMADIGDMIKGASKYILQHCSRNVKVLAPDFLKSDDDFFSDSQMIDLKNVIDKYVCSSIIR